MPQNLLTIPSIFVIAGIGLLIVAIVGELTIKEIRVPPLPRTGRILAALAGIVFIGMGMAYPGGTSELSPEAQINGPAEDSTVPLKTVVTGTLRKPLPAPASYWLLLQDDDGDYYPVRRIAVQQNGAWEEPVTFGPAWKGRAARIVLVQATSEDPLSGAAESGDAIHTLPVSLRTLTTRRVRVQT